MAAAMDPRSRIRLTDGEVDSYLEAQRTVVCASVGTDGAPHLVPLWYVLRPTGPGETLEIWSWTFAKSQKARNLERDPRATLLVEDGLTYERLRGVMLKVRAVAHRDLAAVLDLGLELARRYQGDGVGVPEEARRGVEAQAPKRVGFQFVEQSRISWDHRKLRAAGSLIARAPQAAELATNPRGIHSAERRQSQDKGEIMAESVYRVTEVIGVSSESWEAAARNAVETAGKSVRDLRVAEVLRTDVTIENGKLANYRVRLGISFKYQSGE